jgi:branched-subunit amino acid aminotransferase/4-amino-4-deoxychorismate lyase
MYLINSVQVEKKDFIIPVENMGVWRGDGVFEAIKIHDGYPFAIDLHIERLEKSCSKVFFENIDYKKIKDDIIFIANKYERWLCSYINFTKRTK